MKTNLPSLFAGLAVLLIECSTVPLHGQDSFWTGTTSTDWNTGSNWTPTGVPNPQFGTVHINVTTPAIISLANVGLSSSLNVGSTTGAASLTVENGRNLHVGSGTLLGYEALTTGSLTVTGAGTSANVDTFRIGQSGNGSFTVSDGATVTVSSTPTFVAGSAGSTGTVTVTGAGSKWNNPAALNLGYGGNGSMTISDGGLVTTSVTTLGFLSGGTGTVNVTGAGSSWQNSSTVRVGVAGTGALNISVGGSATADQSYVGAGSGGTGTVTVTGAGSTWNNRQVFVGNVSSGGLLVSAGGAVQVTDAILIGDGATGNATITGANSILNANSVEVGGTTGQGTLTVSNGGSVNSLTGSVGSTGGSKGTVNVTGPGSTWTVTSALNIGTRGQGSVTVGDGGKISAGSINLGSSARAPATLNIGAALGAPAVAAGTIVTSVITGGGGFSTGTNTHVVFNHTDSLYTFAPQLTGALDVTLSGPGTTSLTGNNTYTYGTNVLAGTLLVNNTTGSGVGTGNLIISSGATLGGSGSIGGATTLLAGAHLAPGNSPGTLTFTNGLTLNSGSFLDFQLGTVSDRIAVLSGLFSGPTSGQVTFNFSDAGGFGEGTYTLFTFGDGVTFNSYDLTDFTIGQGFYGYNLTLVKDGQNLELISRFSTVPEPSTYGIFAILGLSGLIAFRARGRDRGALSKKYFF